MNKKQQEKQEQQRNQNKFNSGMRTVKSALLTISIAFLYNDSK
jgi:hypothetical protein